MLRRQIRALAMYKLGLARPLGCLAGVIFVGCLVAGIVYAVVVFNAVRNTPESHHVQHHSTH